MKELKPLLNRSDKGHIIPSKTMAIKSKKTMQSYISSEKQLNWFKGIILCKVSPGSVLHSDTSIQNYYSSYDLS